MEKLFLVKCKLDSHEWEEYVIAYTYEAVELVIKNQYGNVIIEWIKRLEYLKTDYPKTTIV